MYIYIYTLRSKAEIRQNSKISGQNAKCPRYLVKENISTFKLRCNQRNLEKTVKIMKMRITVLLRLFMTLIYRVLTIIIESMI